MNRNKYTFLITIMFVVTFSIIVAQAFRPNEIPNGGVFDCANCHTNPNGGGNRNSFGQQVENGFLTQPGAGGHVIWNSSLASLDSDGDGFTNGEELQDPNGTWSGGSIGNPSLVTNPGDPNSHPSTTSVDVSDNNLIPDNYVLKQNYPNPFNPSTTINFSITNQSFISLNVYNSLGQLVEQLINEELSAGNYSANWRAVNLSSGVYYYTLTTSNFSETKKMILMK